MLFLNTIKYLKPTQILWRFWIKIRRTPKIHVNAGQLDYDIPKLICQCKTKVSGTLKIFNIEIDTGTIKWDNPDKTKLWNYHLHYFDYLENCDQNDGERIIESWIDTNPYGKGVGWEPYPVSLRLVNWIKFIACRAVKPSDKIVKSLYMQMNYLEYYRELHLLANHYFKNCVALLSSTYFFRDQRKFSSLIKTIKRQMEEQSRNGLHFEFSPTYHALFTKDLLDISNLLVANNLEHDFQRELSVLIKQALGWADHLTHAGRYIPIGDSNFEDCPSADELLEYYFRIYSPTDYHRENCQEYFPIIGNQNMKLMLLNSPFNPTYNPAHSHCDKLSVLLWHQNTPVIVDTGNYNYENSSERIYARSINAHNTIQVDDRSQAQMWDVFRVGDRGKINFRYNSESEIIASFSYESAYHERQVKLIESGYEITDRLSCRGLHQYHFYLHFNPDLSFDISENQLNFTEISLRILLPKGTVTVIRTDYYPEMYSKRIKNTIEVSGEFTNQLLLQTKILI